MSIQFSSIWPINMTLSGTTTPGRNGPGSDGQYTALNIKTVLLQTIQFSLSTQYKFKTVLFQAFLFIILFSICIQISPIWAIDRILSGATTPSHSEPGSDSNEGVLCIPNTPALLVPHHQIVSCLIQDTRWGVLPVCRDAIGVFYSPSRLGNDKNSWNHITVSK